MLFQQLFVRLQTIQQLPFCESPFPRLFHLCCWDACHTRLHTIWAGCLAITFHLALGAEYAGKYFAARPSGGAGRHYGVCRSSWHGAGAPLLSLRSYDRKYARWIYLPVRCCSRPWRVN